MEERICGRLRAGGRSPGRRWTGRGRAAAGVALTGILIAGCAIAGGPGATSLAAPPTTAPPAAPSPTPAESGSPATRPALPSGFPVMPGALPGDPPPADPAVIARWDVPVVGSGPYDYYLDALSAAGFGIVGRYPGETSALIRFDAGAGLVWQLVIERSGAGSTITVRTDRP